MGDDSSRRDAGGAQSAFRSDERKAYVGDSNEEREIGDFYCGGYGREGQSETVRMVVQILGATRQRRSSAANR